MVKNGAFVQQRKAPSVATHQFASLTKNEIAGKPRAYCDFTFVYQANTGVFVSLLPFMYNRIRTLSFCFLLLFLVKGAVVFGLDFLQGADDPEKYSRIHQQNNDDAEKTADEKSFLAEEYTCPAVLTSFYPPVTIDPAVKIAIRNTGFHQQVFLSAPELPPDALFL